MVSSEFTTQQSGPSAHAASVRWRTRRQSRGRAGISEALIKAKATLLGLVAMLSCFLFLFSFKPHNHPVKSQMRKLEF